MIGEKQMAYKMAEQIVGTIYNADIITTDYDESIYESLDALLLDIQSYPSNYGITDEIIKIGRKAMPDNNAPKQDWNYYQYSMNDIVVWTVCDYPNECGAEYDGEWYCQWHESLTMNYKYREMVTVVRKGGN